MYKVGTTQRVTDLKHVALFVHDLSMLTDRIKDRCGSSHPHTARPEERASGESRDADCRGINYEQVARGVEHGGGFVALRGRVNTNQIAYCFEQRSTTLLWIVQSNRNSSSFFLICA